MIELLASSTAMCWLAVETVDMSVDSILHVLSCAYMRCKCTVVAAMIGDTDEAPVWWLKFTG